MNTERAAAEEEAAREYADLWEKVGPEDRAAWLDRNHDIIARWSMTALARVKRRAWQIINNRGERWNAHVLAAGPDHLCGAECRRIVHEEANS